MLNNKKTKVVLITMATILVLGATAFSKALSKQAEIFYNGIKLYINGTEIVPKDANGNTVEPFIMNGTTYLPVRAISTAFGEEVEWDGLTQSIYIGKKDRLMPDNYLDKIQYNNFVKANGNCALFQINGTVTDYLGKTYTNGMIFKTYSTTVLTTPKYIEGDRDEFQEIIDYPLNSQYKSLCGNIVLPKVIDSVGLKKDDDYNSRGDSEVYVFFYGDGKLIKKVNAVTKTMPFNFDIDVTGVNTLEIKVKDIIKSLEMSSVLYRTHFFIQ